MTRNSLTRTLQILGLLVVLCLGVLGLSGTGAKAQSAVGCSVSNVVLDPSGNAFNAYTSSPAYPVDVSARFSNCENAPIRFRVWAERGAADTVVLEKAFTLGNHDLVDAKYTILSFGEEDCVAGRSPSCQYYVTFERTDIGPLLLHSSAGVPLSTTRRDVLGYNCDGACLDNITSGGAFQLTNLQSSYVLTLNNADPTWGSVQGGGTYPIGQLANAVASPVQGYYFDYWTEGNTQISQNRAIQVLMNADRTLIAHFTTSTPALTGTSGSGASLVTGECTIGPVQFTPSGNQLFSYGNGWNGDITLQWLATDCYGKKLRFVIGAKSAIAPAPIPVRLQDLVMDDALFGGAYDPNNDIVEFTAVTTLSSAPCDPNLFPACQYFFEVADITNPSAVNVLYSSRGDSLRSTGRDVVGFECSGIGTCGTNFASSTLPFTTRVLAKEYPLNVSVQVIGSTVSPSVAGSVSGAGVYPINSNVNVAATPNPGYEFAYWEDVNGDQYSTPRIFVSVDRERSLTAYFQSNILRTVTVNVIGNGSVTGGGQIPENSGFELIATPNPGNRLLAWRTISPTTPSVKTVVGRSSGLLVTFVDNGQGGLVARANGMNLDDVSPDGDVVIEAEFEEFADIGIGAVSTDGATALVPCEDDCSWNDIIELISNVINFIFILILPLAGVVAVVTGIMILTSGGNPARRSKAKQAFGKFILGIIVVMVAWLLVATILNLLGAKDAYSLLDL